jgi:hypothetical protein
MTSQPAQRITALTEADRQRLRDQGAVIERSISDKTSHQRYQKAAGKLGTIRAIPQERVFEPNQTYELPCLGIVLGDAFVQELNMGWVMVEDEIGRDPALRLPNSNIILFPSTMISKRVERGEKVDPFKPFNGIAAQVDRVQSQQG